ncbi:MAG: hypothetical protein WC458_01695 [Patescibacteria group bacterium]
MTNRELVVKLNNLKKINPDQNWLKSNRELLLSQISNSGAVELSAWKIFVINFESTMRAASRPAYALGVFVLMLVVGSLFSQRTLNKTKPNDSLYIARIISEKVKLNTMFNSQERNKLAVQFASEHARDITAVLADPQFNTEENQDQVAKLNDSFKKEVVTVKEGINRLAATTKDQPIAQSELLTIADSSKDTQGIQLSTGTGAGNTAPIAINPINPSISATATGAVNPEIILPAVSDGALIASSASSTLVVPVPAADNVSDSDKILDEAQKLFDSANYTQASDKLQEAIDEIIK